MDHYYGQHIFISKGVYTHHGIGLGNGKIIHYAGFSEAWEIGPVEIITLDEFTLGAEVNIKVYEDRKFSEHETVERALSRLGEDGYTLWGNNCEHFASWAITGAHSSEQVTIAGVLLTISTFVIGAAGYAATAYLGKVASNQKIAPVPTKNNHFLRSLLAPEKV
ncbi:lecithin retinol acyltransferase family protein [Algivirga pacifica]|uniref:Lecithin retinol acyltransferase family protein n=1 Tax=Algivirga pacifica TaxID=1162670 RepID=A0ABP9DFN5_9BACT